MATLSIRLLGDVALQLDGRPVRFARRCGLALVVYLASAGRAQSRSALATLIAGESDEASASMALRNALRDLRAVLGDHIQIDTRSVALASTLTLSSDVTSFETAARASLQQQSLGVLREAVACYGGEFAPGLVLKGAPEFDEWLLHERERLRDLFLRVLAQLAAAEERAGDRASAILTTRRLLAADPWREEAHRSLIRLLVADGQRAAALVQFEQCRTILQRELGVEPQPESLALAEQLHAGPVAPPHNLPARPTTFVDRPAERALLAEQLQHPNYRLMSIVGIGGVGKTRLALELGAEFTRPALPADHAFPDGVFFVTCGEADGSGTSSTRRLSLALLRGLNLTVASGANPDEALLRWLAPKKLLLIIDNAEAEPAVAAFVQAVLAAAPEVRLLVTSRVRLRLEAEWVFDVGGLSLPAGVEDLPSSEAGQLFLERARAVRLRRQPALYDYPHIVQICRLVGGLPLGLVLAAGRLRALTCAEIAEQLTGDLGLLVSEAPDLPERQRNLSAVLRWSYSQLRPEEAGCLRLLAVFPGEFDRAAASAVSGCSSGQLEALVDSGLLTYASGRTYSLHPLVRQLAAEELRRTADELSSAAATGLRGPQQQTWLEQLAEERQNLDAALSWCLQGGGDPQAGLAIAGNLYWFWLARGLFREGRAWLEQALARCGDCAPAAARARALVALGDIVTVQADIARAVPLLDEGLTLFQEVGDDDGRADALYLLGWAVFRQGDAARAKALVEEGLGLARAIGNPSAATWALIHHGLIDLNMDALIAAARYFSEAQAIAQANGDRFSQVHALHDLGHVAFGQGAYQQAEMYFEESVRLADTAERGLIPWILLSLARVAKLQGGMSRAVALAREGLAGLRDRAAVAGVLEGLEVLAGIANAISSGGRSMTWSRLSIRTFWARSASSFPRQHLLIIGAPGVILRGSRWWIKPWPSQHRKCRWYLSSAL